MGGSGEGEGQIALICKLCLKEAQVQPPNAADEGTGEADNDRSKQGEDRIKKCVGVFVNLTAAGGPEQDAADQGGSQRDQTAQTVGLADTFPFML